MNRCLGHSRGSLSLLRSHRSIKATVARRQLVIQSKTTGGGKSQDGGTEEKPKKRQTPNVFLSYFRDGALIMGDAVMITATQLSSERIPWDQDTKYLLGTAVISWFLAACALGDYRGKPPESDNAFIQLVLGAAFIRVLDATVTWAVAAVLAAGVFAFMVSHVIIDPAPLMDGLGTDDLSPQLEIAIAALITMSCWRGIVAKMRY